MADNHTQEQRHLNMVHIHSQGTRPEEAVRKYLFSRKLRYRKNDKRYPGSPDIVLPKYHVVIFINGCFWHQHAGCRKAVLPKSNMNYWIPKLKRNVDRDKKVHQQLVQMGWRVIVVWECELQKKRIAETLEKLYSAIVFEKR